MESTIFLLLACTAVLAQDASQQVQQPQQEAQKRMGGSYVTSIVHGDSKDGHQNAQSSVKVNLHSTNDHYHQEQQQPQQQSSYQSLNQYSQIDPLQKPNSQVYLQYQKEQQPQTFNNNFQYQEKQPEQIYYQQQPEPLPSPQMYYQIQPLQQENPIKYTGPKSSAVIQQLAASKQVQIYEAKGITKKEPSQQLYNVGYSINIENSAPKLMYRVPRPVPNAHSYRQQKLLNADVITGTHKDKVEKPNGFNQEYEVNRPANYLTVDQGKVQETAASFESPEKQQLTQVYSDVKNQHGYTWKSVSPSVEISGYHSLNAPYSSEQSQSFDHEAALGRSQGFDMSNVVENGKKPYKGVSISSEAKGFDTTKDQTTTVDTESKEPSQNFDDSKYIGPSNQQSGTGNQNFDLAKYFETQKQQSEIQGFDVSKYLEATKSGNNNPGFNVGHTDFSSATNNYQSTPFKFETPHKYDFGSQFQNGGLNLFNYQSEPYGTNYFSGQQEVFDKSLLSNFYKNYKPAFYSPEVTLPSPGIPQSINLGLHQASSNQNSIHIPSYQFKLPNQYEQLKAQLELPKNHYEKNQYEIPKQKFEFTKNQYGQLSNQYEQPQTQYELPKNQYASADFKSQDNSYQSAPTSQTQSTPFHPQQVNEHFQAPAKDQQQPESQMMIQQHYAFVQAEGAQQPQAQALTQGYEESKPVLGPHHEEFQGQQSQEYQTIQLPKDFHIQGNQQYQTHQIPKEQKQIEHHGHHEHKTYIPHNSPSRPHSPRSVMYEHNFRLKTNLRPPPMLIIRQKH